MSFTFICNDVVNNVLESQGLSILNQLLLHNFNSPLYQALLESGVAPSYTPGTGYESGIKQGMFNIGVSGISKQQIQEVEDVIFNCLEKSQIEGFDKETIEGVLHQIEINNKMQQQNFGINLLMNILNQYNHDGEVNQILKISENISILREKIFKEKYLEQLIQKYLNKKNVRIQLIMEPDDQYHQKIAQQEQIKLEQLEKKIDKEKIIQQNKILQEQQNLKEDYECLPKLEISDIDREVLKNVFTQQTYKDIPIYFNNQNTNGLTFLRIQFDLEQVPLYIRKYINMFSIFLNKIGTKSINYKDFQKKLSLYSTNLSFNYESSNPYNFDETNNNKPLNYGLLSIACIDKNIDQMCELLQELLTAPDFKDMQNISTILRNYSNDISNNIIEQALSYSVSVSQASLMENCFIKEKLNHTRFLFQFTNNFLQKNNNSMLYLDDLNFHMNSIMQFMMRKNKIKFIVYGNQQNFDKTYQNISKIIDNLTYAFSAFKYKAEQSKIYDNPFQKKYISKYFALDSQVNYCVQSFEMPNYTNKDTPKLQLLGQLIGDVVLHKEIREKGGAYGSGCQFMDGTLNLFSYRDPNTLETFKIYQNAIKQISKGQFDEKNIEESKLSLFSKIDQIIKPQDRGLAYVLENKTDEMRQQYRQEIIDATRDDLVRVCKEYLVKKIEDNQFSKVVFGNQLNDLKEIEKEGFIIEEPIYGLQNNE
ncbi:peptidase M16 inactive domain protein [Ichthyophthirius multifiliis]|uniref:Peptidase M16 inactive domain protein n=1 Tax=Ichthyophthirius multifiliis TaxID=5932 RepID=G0QLI8_ICHMU|nr:peptidase M16 inactive domain protein [Ichthyophthirius multifiliis]EGR33914.1 peptidase M16 inactive domain protein [Ichthyophthirius multifiliis]|eukprot:XP_004039218.1 peptidase M16 inactive domain protein [Ichthyophthirius multifiliis]